MVIFNSYVELPEESRGYLMAVIPAMKTTMVFQ
jgi:hypothetical protein